MRPRSSIGLPGCWPVSRNPRWPRSSIIWNNSKKARHDYRHHLITLKGLLEQKETEFALEYINDYLALCNPGHHPVLSESFLQRAAQLLHTNSPVPGYRSKLLHLPASEPSCAGDRLLHYPGQPSLQCSGGMPKADPGNALHHHQHRTGRRIHDCPVHTEHPIPISYV